MSRGLYHAPYRFGQDYISRLDHAANLDSAIIRQINNIHILISEVYLIMLDKLGNQMRVRATSMI